MANKDLTRERVGNVMHQIPKSAMKDTGKMRKTLHRTFSGMKTLVNQLSEIKLDYKEVYKKKQQRGKRFRRAMLVIEIAIGLIIFLSITFFILARFGIL